MSKKNKPAVRSRVAVTRLTEQEFRELLFASSRQDLSFSDFLRTAALEKARSFVDG